MKMRCYIPVVVLMYLYSHGLSHVSAFFADTTSRGSELSSTPTRMLPVDGSSPDPSTQEQPAPKLSRYLRIHFYYHCPSSGPTTRYFDLGVEYTGGEVDHVEWKKYTNVDEIKREGRRDRRPIKATSVFSHDTCPPNQPVDNVCSYHFEGHLNADIYTHFITLEMVETTRPSDLRAPIVWESCLDLSRRARGIEDCGVVSSWQLCYITNFAFEPFHPPPPPDHD